MKRHCIHQDVQFCFPGEQDANLGAHSFWLAHCSEVFQVPLDFLSSCHSYFVQAQFFGSMKQLHPCVEDFSRESFKLFIDILYVKTQNWTDIKLSTYSDLLRLADKYMVPGLDNFVWTKLVEKVGSYMKMCKWKQILK